MARLTDEERRLLEAERKQGMTHSLLQGQDAPFGMLKIGKNQYDLGRPSDWERGFQLKGKGLPADTLFQLGKWALPPGFEHFLPQANMPGGAADLRQRGVEQGTIPGDPAQYGMQDRSSGVATGSPNAGEQLGGLVADLVLQPAGMKAAQLGKAGLLTIAPQARQMGGRAAAGIKDLMTLPDNLALAGAGGPASFPAPRQNDWVTMMAAAAKGGGGGKPPKPPKPPPPPKQTIGNMWDAVPNEATAMPMARAGAHLKQDATGKYIGGPDWVSWPGQLGSMRMGMDDMLTRGLENANWYDRARSGIMDVTGYSPNMAPNSKEATMAQLFARGAAPYSIKSTPIDETNSFLKQHNAKMLTGQDRQARMGFQMNMVAPAYTRLPDGTYEITPGNIGLGPKIGPYAMAKDPTLPFDWKTANDIRHGRAYGYRMPNGDIFDRGFSDAEHGFLHGENLLISDRARQNAPTIPAGRASTGENIPGGLDWNVPRTQAAIWATQAYDVANAKNLKAIADKTADLERWNAGDKTGLKKKPVVPERLTHEEMWADASAGVDDAIMRNTAFANWEVTPGENTPHFMGLSKDKALNDAYSKARIEQAAVRDPYYQSLQQFVRPTERATSRGWWDPGMGLPTQENYQGITRMLADIEAGGVINPTTQRGMNTVEWLRSAMNAQSGGGTHFLVPSTKSADISTQKGSLLDIPDVSGAPGAMEGHIEELRKVIPELRNTGLNVVDDRNGRFSVGRFDQDWTGEDVQNKVNSVLGNYKALTNTPATWNSDFVGVPWGKDAAGNPTQGTGVVTKEMVKVLTGKSKNPQMLPIPDLASRLDVHGGTNAEIAAANAADRAFAAQNPQYQPADDLLKLRDIVGQQGGWQKLLEYVKKNGYQGLPAVFGPSLLDTSGLWQQQQEDRGW